MCGIETNSPIRILLTATPIPRIGTKSGCLFDLVALSTNSVGSCMFLAIVFSEYQFGTAACWFTIPVVVFHLPTLCWLAARWERHPVCKIPAPAIHEYF